MVIRNGHVVNGLGDEAKLTDVAIAKGRISFAGKFAERGQEEFDADGLTVSPGFIDIHTHLNAQVGWDPDLTAVSLHGVTAALMGNCEVTFAPVKVQKNLRRLLKYSDNSE